MTHASLFSGIGGPDLAAEWMGWENIFHCEINSFAQKILKYYWPNSISYENIKTTNFSIHRGTVDVLTGGFPCQGYSLAGLRLGTEDDRYLWPEMLRTIDESQPTWIVGENVTGILSMEDKSGIYRDVFPEMEGRTITRLCEIDKYEAVYTRQAKMLVNSICEDLEKRGYEVQTFAIPAASVQAPHQRERIWFVAYSDRHDAGGCGHGETGCKTRKTESEQKKREWIWPIPKRTCQKIITPNSNSGECSSRIKSRFQENSKEKGTGLDGRSSRFSNDRTKPDWNNFPTQSPVCDGNDGVSARLDGITFPKWRSESIKAGGNAIVPQVIFQIFQSINLYNKKYAKH